VCHFLSVFLSLSQTLSSSLRRSTPILSLPHLLPILILISTPTKGRVACEMNTCDELTATEMLFYNVLEPLNPPEAAAILSALVFQVRVFVCVCVGGGAVLLLYYCADGYDIISFISSY
jgi:hypothetical protein